MVDGPVALAAAGVVKAGEHRDPPKQGGFAGPVFTGDDRDRPIETQLEVIVQERQTKRIRLAVGDARWIEPDPPQVRRRHPNVALSSGAHAPPPHSAFETLNDLLSRFGDFSYRSTTTGFVAR